MTLFYRQVCGSLKVNTAPLVKQRYYCRSRRLSDRPETGDEVLVALQALYLLVKKPWVHGLNCSNIIIDAVTILTLGVFDWAIDSG